MRFQLFALLLWMEAVTSFRTFIMVKPDGVRRGLTGDIISRFEAEGLRLVEARLRHADEALLRAHYCEIVDRPFFPECLEYMRSGPVMAMAFEGEDVVALSRGLIGATDPAHAAPGTIRADFGTDVTQNVCHGSDSDDSALRELSLWFDYKTSCPI